MKVSLGETLPTPQNFPIYKVMVLAVFLICSSVAGWGVLPEEKEMLKGKI